MLLRLVLLLTVVPVAELYLLVQLTRWWDSLALTIGLVVGTGVLGATLARLEGLRVVRSMQRDLAAGRLPADGILNGVLVLVAAALLLTPGLLTDALGFALLVPPSRAVIASLLRRWIRRHIAAGTIRFESQQGFQPIHDEPPAGFPPLEDED